MMIEIIIRLAPEQNEHQHEEVTTYDLRRCLFICSGNNGCGALLVIPELAETLHDTLATEVHADAN